MDLPLLKAELNRLSERYRWLRHAFVMLESEHPWSHYHDGLQRAMRECMGDFGGTAPSVLDWFPRYGHGLGYSVLFTNTPCADEAVSDAIRDLKSIAKAVTQHVAFTSRHWKGPEKPERLPGLPRCTGHVVELRDGAVMSVSGDLRNDHRLLLEHLDAVLQPERRYAARRVDAENLAEFGIYELHTDPFAATRACLARPESNGALAPRRELTETEQNILEALGDKTLESDDIAAEAGYSSGHTRRLLSQLKREGFVVHESGQGYSQPR